MLLDMIRSVMATLGIATALPSNIEPQEETVQNEEYDSTEARSNIGSGTKEPSFIDVKDPELSSIEIKEQGVIECGENSVISHSPPSHSTGGVWTKEDYRIVEVNSYISR